MKLLLSLAGTWSGHIEMLISAVAHSINYGCSGADALRFICSEISILNVSVSGKRPESE
jgi:hypothetical protein